MSAMSRDLEPGRFLGHVVDEACWGTSFEAEPSSLLRGASNLALVSLAPASAPVVDLVPDRPHARGVPTGGQTDNLTT